MASLSLLFSFPSCHVLGVIAAASKGGLPRFPDVEAVGSSSFKGVIAFDGCCAGGGDGGFAVAAFSRCLLTASARYFFNSSFVKLDYPVVVDPFFRPLFFKTHSCYWRGSLC